MKQAINRTLYQIQVTDNQRGDIFIGPRVDQQRVLEPLAEAINLSVAQGKQRDWHDARIVTLQAPTI